MGSQWYSTLATTTIPELTVNDVAGGFLMLVGGEHGSCLGVENTVLGMSYVISASPV